MVIPEQFLYSTPRYTLTMTIHEHAGPQLAHELECVVTSLDCPDDVFLKHLLALRMIRAQLEQRSLKVAGG